MFRNNVVTAISFGIAGDNTFNQSTQSVSINSGDTVAIFAKATTLGFGVAYGIEVVPEIKGETFYSFNRDFSSSGIRLS